MYQVQRCQSISGVNFPYMCMKSSATLQCASAVICPSCVAVPRYFGGCARLTTCGDSDQVACFPHVSTVSHNVQTKH